MPTDFKSMRNRINAEFVDEELRANKRVFDLEKKNLLEDRPSLPSPSIATIAENGRLSALAISALKDVNANMLGRLNVKNLKNQSISTADFGKAREGFINWFSNLQYRVLPVLGSSTSGDLLRNTAKDVVQVMDQLREVVNRMTTAIIAVNREIQSTPPQTDKTNWEIALAVLSDERQNFSSYLQQVSAIPSAISNILPAQVKLSESVPLHREYQQQQQADEEELKGEGRKTMFVEDNDFYVEPTQDYEPEVVGSAKARAKEIRPQVQTKVVYQGQGLKDKCYKNAREKVELIEPPRYDPIGNQLSDIKGADERFEREVVDDNLRFRIVDKKKKK